MPFGGAGIAGLGVIGNIIGGIAGQNAGAGDRAKATDAVNSAYQQLLQTGMPPDEAKPIVYKQFQQQGLLTPQVEQAINQHPSQMASVTGSQPAQQAQMQALQALQQRGQAGLTPEDRAALNQVRQQVASDTQAKQQAIQQQFAARGQGGSGAELIGALQASQSGANAESQAGDRLAAMASQNALQAIGQAGTLGGQIQGQQFGEQAQKAQAQDVINAFNTQNQIGQQARNVAGANQAQQYNLGQGQQIANANTQQGNQELLRQNQAQRQTYLDTLNRAQAINQGANQYANQMNAAGEAASKSAAAPWQAIGAGATTIGTSMMKPQAAPGGGGTTNNYYSDGGHVSTDKPIEDPESAGPSIYGGEEISKEKYNQLIQNSLDEMDPVRKAMGGQIAPHIQQLRKIFPSVSDDSLHEIHMRANPHMYSYGAAVRQPDEHQRRMGVTDYRVGGHVPGQAPVPGNSPQNDIVDAKLSPGEYVIKRTDAKSPFGKKLIKLLEAHHEVMKHDNGQS